MSYRQLFPKVVLIRTVQITLTPDEVANAFWSFDSDQQAAVLNCLAQITPDSYKRNMQFAYLRDSEDLTEHAREFVSELYLYLEGKR